MSSSFVTACHLFSPYSTRFSHLRGTNPIQTALIRSISYSSIDLNLFHYSICYSIAKNKTLQVNDVFFICCCVSFVFPAYWTRFSHLCGFNLVQTLLLYDKYLLSLTIYFTITLEQFWWSTESRK